MTGNARLEISLMITCAALLGAGLGLSIAVAADIQAISLGWRPSDPITNGTFHSGLILGAIFGGAVYYRSNTSQRLRIFCILAAATIGAFACMTIVLGSGILVMRLLSHDRATADLAFEVIFRMLPFAMICGAIGGGTLGPFAERMGIAWSRSVIDRFGRTSSG